ncbi:MAG TPA: PRC-barrel domain-containing protein [Chloroflexota bacterium]|nr:PRC-barrel domain-containing protein [Chloroflexota bacterium]
MVTNEQTVQNGMDVYDATGEKIGTVADVYTVQARSQGNAMTPPSTSQGSVFKVNEGGVMGIGATELYIPFSAVQTVTPGDRITLNTTKAKVDAEYARKPAFLDDNG